MMLMVMTVRRGEDNGEVMVEKRKEIVLMVVRMMMILSLQQQRWLEQDR